MKYTAELKKPERHFLRENFTITDWENLEPYFKDLLDRKISSREELDQWLLDMSELDAVVSEDACWRQIRMTCDTENKQLEEAFTYFMMEIQPRIQPYSDQLNRKLIANPLTAGLDQKEYFTFLRSVRKSIDLFREQNISLLAELSVLGQ